MLSTAGLVGLVGFLVLMVGSLVVLWRMDPRYGLVAFVVILSRLVQGQLDLFWVAVQTSIPFLIVGICLGAHGRELAEQPPGRRAGHRTHARRCPGPARQGHRVTDAPTLDIVHVCCTNAFAGVERHVSELAAAQAALGHRVTVVGGDQPGSEPSQGTASTVLPGQAIRVALRSLRRLLARPDVVNVHMTAAEVALAPGPVAAWRAGRQHPPLRRPPRDPPTDAAWSPSGHPPGRRPARGVAVRRRPRRRGQHRRAERGPAASPTGAWRRTTGRRRPGRPAPRAREGHRRRRPRVRARRVSPAQGWRLPIAGDGRAARRAQGAGGSARGRRRRGVPRLPPRRVGADARGRRAPGARAPTRRSACPWSRRWPEDCPSWRRARAATSRPWAPSPAPRCSGPVTPRTPHGCCASWRSSERGARGLRRPAPGRPARAVHGGRSRPAGPTSSTGGCCDGPRRRLARGLGRRLATQPAPGLAAAGGRPRPPRAVRRAARRPAARPPSPLAVPTAASGSASAERPAVAVPAHQVAAPQARPGGRRAAVVRRRAGGRTGGHDRGRCCGSTTRWPPTCCAGRAGPRSTTSPTTGCWPTARRASTTGSSRARRYLLDHCRHVVVCSPRLLETKSRGRAERVTLVPNAVDVDAYRADAAAARRPAVRSGGPLRRHAAPRPARRRPVRRAGRAACRDGDASSSSVPSPWTPPTSARLADAGAVLLGAARAHRRCRRTSRTPTCSWCRTSSPPSPTASTRSRSTSTSPPRARGEHARGRVPRPRTRLRGHRRPGGVRRCGTTRPDRGSASTRRRSRGDVGRARGGHAAGCSTRSGASAASSRRPLAALPATRAPKASEASPEDHRRTGTREHAGEVRARPRRARHQGAHPPVRRPASVDARAVQRWPRTARTTSS